MGQVLAIVYRCIATHLVKKAGFACRTAQTGAVTLIQRFGSALNLNIHFHMLFLDGVYVERPDGSLRFRWVKAPTSAEVTHLTHTLAHRIGRFLERQGLVERDAENNYFAADAVDEDSMAQLLGHSITYRIAVGPQPDTLPRSVCPFMLFGCNSKHRALVTPSRRGRGSKPKATDEGHEQSLAERRVSMSCTQRA